MTRGEKFFTFFYLLTVGTCWDKDFRICLVLSSQKVDHVAEKNTEFYVPEEQVNLKSTCPSLVHSHLKIAH